MEAWARFLVQPPGTPATDHHNVVQSRNATRNTDAELRRAILQVIPPTLAETGIDTIRLALATCASPDISEIRKPDSSASNAPMG